VSGGKRRGLRSFLKEVKGNVAILFATAIIPVALGAGAAIDYGRALAVRARMVDAADAAALAIGSWPGLTDDELIAKAHQFFDAKLFSHIPRHGRASRRGAAR
jgi:Flp pilus assembly protein TadG